jgi:hypothetical protein
MIEGGLGQMLELVCTKGRFSTGFLGAKKFLATNPPHTAGHHGFDGSHRRLTRQDARIISHELALEREPCDVFLVIADAASYILEAPLGDEAEPSCWFTLSLQQVALMVNGCLAFPLAELL